MSNTNVGFFTTLLNKIPADMMSVWENKNNLPIRELILGIEKKSRSERRWSKRFFWAGIVMAAINLVYYAVVSRMEQSLQPKFGPVIWAMGMLIMTFLFAIMQYFSDKSSQTSNKSHDLTRKLSADLKEIDPGFEESGPLPRNLNRAIVQLRLEFLAFKALQTYRILKVVRLDLTRPTAEVQSAAIDDLNANAQFDSAWNAAHQFFAESFNKEAIFREGEVRYAAFYSNN